MHPLEYDCAIWFLDEPKNACLQFEYMFNSELIDFRDISRGTP